MYTENEIVYLHLEDIIPNRFQPREVFEDNALKELALSIKEHGVIQPIIVRNIGNKYEIIAGERRYKASALAGLTKIPAIVRNLDDKESSKVALLENLQRKNLNPIEEARTYQKILEIDEMTQEELAKTMGKSQSAVANKLRLLALSDEVQQALLKEKISERHARTLLSISNKEAQKEMLDKVISTRMTVRELENQIKNNINNESHNETNKFMGENESVGGNIMPDFNIPNPELNNIKPIDYSTPLNTSDSNNSNEANANELEQPKQDNYNTNSYVDTNNISVEKEQPKFVNYGEVSADEAYENIESYQGDITTAGKQMDINTLKSTTEDINVDNHKIADLDSLLKLDPVSTMEKEEPKLVEQSPVEQPSYKYFSTEEEKPKEEEKQPSSQESIMGGNLFNIPMAQQFNMNTQFEQPNAIINDKPLTNAKLAIDKYKNLTKELEDIGYNIKLEEMDFGNTYQLIINIINKK